MKFNTIVSCRIAHNVTSEILYLVYWLVVFLSNNRGMTLKRRLDFNDNVKDHKKKIDLSIKSEL